MSRLLKAMIALDKATGAMKINFRNKMPYRVFREKRFLWVWGDD